MHSDAVSSANWIHCITDQGSTDTNTLHSDAVSSANCIHISADHYLGSTDNFEIHSDVEIEHYITDQGFTDTTTLHLDVSAMQIEYTNWLKVDNALRYSEEWKQNILTDNAEIHSDVVSIAKIFKATLHFKIVTPSNLQCMNIINSELANSAIIYILLRLQFKAAYICIAKCTSFCIA